MEVSNLKYKVNKVEQEILQLINKLNYETGVKTECIELCSLTTNSKTGFTATSITDVKITFTI